MAGDSSPVRGDNRVGRERQSARGALHLAVLARYGVRTNFSFDGDYDRWPGAFDRMARIRICRSTPADRRGSMPRLSATVAEFQ